MTEVASLQNVPQYSYPMSEVGRENDEPFCLRAQCDWLGRLHETGDEVQYFLFLQGIVSANTGLTKLSAQ